MSAKIFNLDDDERFVRQIGPAPDGFSGAISLPLLPDLIQIYTVSLADGALTIRQGHESGTIWFEHGAMVHAVCRDSVGEEAVYQMLHWHKGEFTLDPAARAPMHSISLSWQEVLIEGCRKLDEEPAVTLAPENAGSVLNAIAEATEGFLASAIFDATNGALLAQRSTPNRDLSLAGPHDAEMVRQQSKIAVALGQPESLVDCFFILGEELHLLKPLPGERLLHLAAARAGMNLALMRRVVEQALANAT